MPTLLDSKKGVAIGQKTRCSVCWGGRLTRVLDLPKLPLTGIYVESPCPGRYPDFDQSLMLCADCGHAQLLHVIDPWYLYGETYSHRSSASGIATQGNEFFVKFLEKVSGGRRFRSAVEIGCNDLFLLRRLEPKCEKLFGIDPIWKEKPLPEDSKISVIGKFIEAVDLKKEIPIPPDLVVSAHAFEHLNDSRGPLEALVRFAAPEALFVIEVPGFDSLLKASRFDQVFHQHIHYFSVASFRRLIERVGGRYLTHTFNYEYWNGTLLMAFCKSGSSDEKKSSESSEVPGADLIRRRYREFEERMARVSEFLGNLEKPIYGYGAAQMLPTLAYHLKSDLNFLESILDDDPRRADLYYPDLAPRIRMPGPDFEFQNASVLITALDSMRPILKRLLGKPLKYVINPLSFF